MKKSVFGLDENIAAAAAYIFSLISGIVILIMERENRFVRFHAMQSVLLGVVVSVVNVALQFLRGIPFLGGLFAPVISVFGLLSLIAFIVSAYHAFKMELFRLPIIGDVAAKQMEKA
ncbi:MAG: DUF4870 domain-containing protein [Clostridiales bacterium]|jgi:uncharacterized membrane protein|nr:DUF4870 domain-containing protein [Clostridiales bacterium]